MCASQVFAYLTRWVPAHEGRSRPKPVAPPEAEVYRAITAPPGSTSRRLRMLVPGMLGVGALGVAGWIWKGSAGARAAKDEKEKTRRKP